MLRGGDDGRHAVVDRADQFVGGHGDEAERPLPRAILIAPVLPDAGDAKRRAVFHGEGVQLLAFVALVERVHRHDAAAPRIGVGEHALVGDGLGAGIDRLNFGPRFHPVRNEAPAQHRRGCFAGHRMAAPHRQFARRLCIGFAEHRRFDARVGYERVFLGTHSDKAAHAGLQAGGGIEQNKNIKVKWLRPVKWVASGVERGVPQGRIVAGRRRPRLAAPGGAAGERLRRRWLQDHPRRLQGFVAVPARPLRGA